MIKAKALKIVSVSGSVLLGLLIGLTIIVGNSIF